MEPDPQLAEVSRQSAELSRQLAELKRQLANSELVREATHEYAQQLERALEERTAETDLLRSELATAVAERDEALTRAAELADSTSFRIGQVALAPLRLVRRSGSAGK